MRWKRQPKRRTRREAFGMEMAATLSVASQMALLHPGCDEWVYRELSGRNGRAARPPARR